MSKAETTTAWGVMARTPYSTNGPMGVYCEPEHTKQPETSAYTTMAFRRRQDARDWCKKNGIPKGSRRDGWYYVYSPLLLGQAARAGEHQAMIALVLAAAILSTPHRIPSALVVQVSSDTAIVQLGTATWSRTAICNAAGLCLVPTFTRWAGQRVGWLSVRACTSGASSCSPWTQEANLQCATGAGTGCPCDVVKKVDPETWCEYP